MVEVSFQKLFRRKFGLLVFFFLVLFPVVLVLESHAPVFEGNDPAVGYRYAMGVPSDVSDDLVGAGEGGLAVDPPRFGDQLVEFFLESFRGPKLLHRFRDDKLVVVVQLFQSVDEFSPEDLRQRPGRKKEFGAVLRLLPLSVVGQASADDYEMDVDAGLHQLRHVWRIP